MAKKRKLPEEVHEFFEAEGRKGGLIGGKVRAARLSAKRRKEIAAKAARARWAKTKRDKS